MVECVVGANVRFRNIANWEDPERDRGLLYFAQRLDELTFPYTIDSYRPPTMGPPDLAKECLFAVSLARSKSKPVSSIAHILDELEERLKANPMVKGLLSVKLERYLTYDRNSFSDIERSVRVLSQEISRRSYALKCFELAEEYCQTNRKSDIEFVAKEMVTTLINYGVSARQISATVNETFFKSTPVSGTTILKPFFREVFPHQHAFSVLFKYDTPVEALPENVLKLFRVKIEDTVPKEFKGKKGPPGIPKLKANECYLILSNIKATDRYAAVDKANQGIQRVHDLFGIYNHKLKYQFDERAFTLQMCCSDKLSEVKIEDNLMQYTLDNTVADAATKVDRLTGVLRLPGGPDAAKFFRIVAFHGSASQSGNIETQVVNLWTALETMAPSRKNSSIVSDVSRAVLPIISLNYFRRLFQTLTWDILRWNRRLLGRALKNCTLPDNADLVDKVFCLVTFKGNEAALSGLLSDLGNFELLRFRIFSLNKSFSSPTSALTTLLEHEKRVEWQVNRIYRARNRIIHSGASPSNAKSLFANAHDYFDQVFETTCALCSGSSGYNNYKDAFGFSKLLYEQYIEAVRNAPRVEYDTAKSWLWTPPKEPDAKRWFVSDN